MYPWKVGEGSSAPSNIYAWNSQKNAFKSTKGGLTVVPSSLIGSVDTLDVPKDTAMLYGIPNFYWGYSYCPTVNFSGSRQFGFGGVIYCQSATNVTITANGSGGVTFNGFIGVLPIPPLAVVAVSQATAYQDY